MPRRLSLVLASLWLSCSPLFPATGWALKVRIAFPAAYADDIFVKSLLSSKVLVDAGLSLAPQEVLGEAEARWEVDSGAADLSIYTLVDEKLPALKKSGTETSLLTRPFMFKSTEEVLQAQNSFIGAAAATDAGRSGLFPLKLWNHGITYFLSKEKIGGAADFSKLTVAAEKGAPDVKILTAIGAKVVNTAPSATAGVNAMETQLGDATADFAKKYGGKLYLTTGWPTTGLLMAARDFWLQRSEAEKKALGLAAQQARQASDAEIMARRDAIRQIPNVELTNLVSHEQVQLALDSMGYAPDAISREMSLWRKAEAETRTEAVPSPASAPPLPKLAMRSPVFFATDRDDEKTLDYTTRFGSRRLEPFEFTCGYLGSPARNSGEPHLPPAPKTLTKGAEECARQIVAKTRETGGSKIMIVIHGFNTPFDGLAWRALQLGSDVNYDGAIVGWSWPSEGSAFGYAYDEDSSAWSEPHLLELVNDIAEAGPEMRLDLVAHSMGSRMLLQMLRDFALAKAKLRIGAAVFAAPDVAQDVFREQIALARKLGVIRTLYASAYDRAILISESYHQSPRAGSGGADILVTGGVESIDARLGGHSYVFDAPKAMRDFKQILNRVTTAAARGLAERQKDGEPYWLILP